MNSISSVIRNYWIVLCAAAFWLGLRISTYLASLYLSAFNEPVQQNFRMYRFSFNLFNLALFALITFLVIWLAARKRWNLPAAWVYWSVLGFSLSSAIITSGYSLLAEFLLRQGGIATAALAMFGNFLYTPGRLSVIQLVGWALLSTVPGLLIGLGTGAAQAVALKNRNIDRKQWMGAVARAFAIYAALGSVLVSTMIVLRRTTDSALVLFLAETILAVQGLAAGAIYGWLTGPLLGDRAQQTSLPGEKVQDGLLPGG